MSLDCIKDIDNYALTGCTSIYNEDGLTAQQLLITCAKRVKECINVCEVLHTNNYEVVETTNTYNSNAEELVIGLNKLFSAKAYVNRFFFLFKENAKSPIELAGTINSAINECLDVLASTTSLLTNFSDSKVQEDVKVLTSLITGAYVDIFDDCAMTLLELAGITARHVNDLVKAVNSLELITDNIINVYNGDSEEYSTIFSGAEDEILII